MQWIFGIFSLINLLLDLGNVNKEETLLVVTMFRHGARTPKHYVEEVEKTFKKYPIGSLTDNGWRMQFLLGKYLRERLPKNYNITSADVLLISSYKDRTINSAISFASGLTEGMFRLVTFDSFVNRFNFKVCKTRDFNQIISNQKTMRDMIYREKSIYPPLKGFKDEFNKYNIMVVSNQKDILFHGRNCKFTKEFNYTLGKTRSKKFFSDISFSEHKLIFNYLKKEFNVTLRNVTDFKQMTHKDIKNYYLIIKSMDFENPGIFSPLSGETEEAFYKLIFDYYYKLAISSEDQAKMSSSMFFDYLIYFFESKIKRREVEDDLNYKVISFSGHDYNILGVINNLYGREFLFTLDKWKYKDFLFSSYSSSFEFHLVRFDYDEYFVRIYYNGHEPKLRLANHINSEGYSSKTHYIAGKGVPYHQFKRLVKSRIYENYDKCHIKTSQSKVRTMYFALRIYNSIIKNQKKG